MLTATIPNQNARRCAKAIIGPPEMADSLRGIYGNDPAGDSRRVTRLLGLAPVWATQFASVPSDGLTSCRPEATDRGQTPRQLSTTSAQPNPEQGGQGCSTPPSWWTRAAGSPKGECVIGPLGPGKVTECPVWRVWWAAE
jgi:hypothetical protein